ncbi:MAG: Alpha/beta superfamily hydrolase [Gemmatimonadetes bacterium]|jgi:dienelactone hydrolase|nr:Alpha/beta superfamily hydrolase [Gemmatimonadota bacterium]
MSASQPAPARAAREEFELAGAGGLPIRGEARVVPGATRGVVLLHGFKGFYRALFFPRLADELASSGLNVVSFNFAGSGIGADRETFTEPEAFAGNSYGRELYDLTLVLREADAQGWLGDRWGLFGHSRGGGVAVMHAARDARVAALVTWASIASVRRWSDDEMAAWRERGYMEVANQRTGQLFRLGTRVLDEVERHGGGRLDVAQAAAAVRCPWLIVHGDADDVVPLDEGERLAACARDGELLQVAGGSHTFNVAHGFAVESPQLRQALDRTVAFFADRLDAR